jgi:hypothetical protein
MVGAVFEGALKIAALVDLARRPVEQVSGSKKTHGLKVPATTI